MSRDSVERASAATYRAAVVVFAALGDEQRLVLVKRLGQLGQSSLTVLSRDAEITRQGISKHLTVLQQAGLVESERRGRERIFTLVPSRLASAQRALDAIGAEWEDRLAQLKDFVE